MDPAQQPAENVPVDAEGKPLSKKYVAASHVDRSIDGTRLIE